MARNKTSKPITLGSLFKDALSFLFFPVGILATTVAAAATFVAEGADIIKAYFVKGAFGRAVKHDPIAESVYRAFQSVYKATASFTFSFITDTSKEVFHDVGEALAKNTELLSPTQKDEDDSRIIKTDKVLDDVAKHRGITPNTEINPVSAELVENNSRTR